MSTREEQKEQTRQKIVDAAKDLMLAPDFTSLNTNEVAEVAGVSKGLIFHHFSSKDRLIMAGMEELLQEQIQHLLIDTKIDDPIKVLTTLTQNYLDLMTDHSHLTSLLIQLISDLKDEEHLATLDNFVSQFMQNSMKAVVELFMKLGWASKTEAVEAARVYLAILDGLGLQLGLSNMLPSGKLLQMNKPQLTELIVDLFDKRYDNVDNA